MGFFTARGRLRRRGYFLHIVGLYALALAIYAVPGLLYPAEVPAHAVLLAALGFGGVGYLMLMQSLRRLHDLNLSSWWALVLLLPGVSYVLGGGLQFVPGTAGPNRFGPDSRRPGAKASGPPLPAPVGD